MAADGCDGSLMAGISRGAGRANDDGVLVEWKISSVNLGLTLMNRRSDYDTTEWPDESDESRGECDSDEDEPCYWLYQ